MSRIEKVNITLTVLISVGFVAMAIFVFPMSYLRFWETLVDLWNSLRFYINEIFCPGNAVDVTVNKYSQVFTWETWLPESWDGFTDKTCLFFERLFTKENILAYIEYLNLVEVLKVLIVIIPLLLILFLIIKQVYYFVFVTFSKKDLPNFG